MTSFATPQTFPDAGSVMRHALELARRGIGQVEPNPAVGCVIVDENLQLIAAGWHQRYGGLHAEAEALRSAGERARGATLYVTLEPCAHFGRTPPCAEAIIAAGIRKVVAAVADPAPHTNGGGFRALRAAGIEVETGLCAEEAEGLIAPFFRLFTTGLPFVHAKWGMSLDGKIATHRGESQWITNETSRRLVHELRGRMDAILVGIGTALADDPLLTARPSGSRVPLRVVLDTDARLPVESQLVNTVAEAPVVLFTGTQADPARVHRLRSRGVEVVPVSLQRGRIELLSALRELGSRRCTNIFVEGGSGLLGSFRDAQLIDEVHCFLAPKLIGGTGAPGPFGGEGAADLADALRLTRVDVRVLEGDVYVCGRVKRTASASIPPGA